MSVQNEMQLFVADLQNMNIELVNDAKARVGNRTISFDYRPTRTKLRHLAGSHVQLNEFFF